MSSNKLKNNPNPVVAKGSLQMKYDEYSGIVDRVFEECGVERTPLDKSAEDDSTELYTFLWADAARVTTTNDAGEISPIGKVAYGPKFADDLRSLIRKFDEEDGQVVAATDDTLKGEAKA